MRDRGQRTVERHDPLRERQARSRRDEPRRAQHRLRGRAGTASAIDSTSTRRRACSSGSAAPARRGGRPASIQPLAPGLDQLAQRAKSGRGPVLVGRHDRLRRARPPGQVGLGEAAPRRTGRMSCAGSTPRAYRIVYGVVVARGYGRAAAHARSARSRPRTLRERANRGRGHVRGPGSTRTGGVRDLTAATPGAAEAPSSSPPRGADRAGVATRARPASSPASCPRRRGSRSTLRAAGTSTTAAGPAELRRSRSIWPDQGRRRNVHDHVGGAAPMEPSPCRALRVLVVDQPRLQGVTSAFEGGTVR